MIQCNHCQAENQEGVAYCTSCGQSMGGAPPQAQSYEPQAYGQQAYGQSYSQPYGKTQNTTGALVWSICNLVLCCLPLGIISLIFTVQASNAMNRQEFEEKMKVSKICNIISTSVGALLYVTSIIFYVFVMGAMIASGTDIWGY